MVDEGLENLLYKHIQSCSSMEEFINQLSSKRYTRPRISRMLIHILMKNTKNDIHNACANSYVRIQKNERHIELLLSDFPNHVRKGMIYYKHYKDEIDDLFHQIVNIHLQVIKY